MAIVRTTPRADLEAEKANRWSQRHRTRGDVFREEYGAALSFLEHSAEIPPVALKVRGVETRRVLLRRAGCHVYYQLEPGTGDVLIVSIWGSRRGRGPFFRKRGP